MPVSKCTCWIFGSRNFRLETYATESSTQFPWWKQVVPQLADSQQCRQAMSSLLRSRCYSSGYASISSRHKSGNCKICARLPCWSVSQSCPSSLVRLASNSWRNVLRGIAKRKYSSSWRYSWCTRMRCFCNSLTGFKNSTQAYHSRKLIWVEFSLVPLTHNWVSDRVISNRCHM